MRLRSVLGFVFVVLATVSGAPASIADGTPQLAYTGGASLARTALVDGTVIRNFRNLEPFASLDTNVLVGSRLTPKGTGSSLVGFDATSGAVLFKVHDGRFPLITHGGSGVAFLPDFNGSGPDERDPRVNSVWWYDVGSARDHRLIRFRDPDRMPLSLAASPGGRLVAVGHGNDVDLFRSDVYIARTDVRRTGRLTTSGKAWYPSFGPDGTQLAYTFRNPKDPCSGGIHLIRVDGTHDSTLVKGKCARVLLRPVWLDTNTIVAWWWDQTGPQGLVSVDATTGDVTTIVSGPVVDFSLSRPLGKIAYRLTDDSLHVYDVATATVSDLLGGSDLPGGKVWLDGSLELAY